MVRDPASGPTTQRPRLFVAIEIPPAAKEALTEAIGPLRARFPDARWTPEANWHVTVKFVGATSLNLFNWVSERLEAVAADAGPVRTKVSGLGCFPSSRRARVVWAGLEDAPGRIAELALGVDAALSKEFKPDTRPFSPHLTIARSDPAIELPPGWDVMTVATDPFTVGELVLFRSHLQRPGPRYEPLARFRLAG